jgi:hypothetical protein
MENDFMIQIICVFLFITTTIFGVLFIIWLFKHHKTKKQLGERDREIERIQTATQVALQEAQALSTQQIAEYQQYAEQIQTHFETEARRMYDQMMVTFQEQNQRVESLQRFEHLEREEAEVKHTLTLALRQAEALQGEAQAMINEAERHAKEIAGDAYAAIRDKEQLEEAIQSIENTIKGYGDKYIIPEHSLLDELAEGFEHAEAGVKLAEARTNTRYLIGQRLAASCEYEDADRNETAVRFVIDAFNGRVDAILSRVKHDNYGTLKQKIDDTFNLVNLNGKAFMNARIEQAYLESRLAELHWATVTQELKRQEREEQRQLKEQMREEEKARREYEKAQKKAEEEERLINQALQEAEGEEARVREQERREYEAKMEELRRQLEEAGNEERLITQALAEAEAEATRVRDEDRTKSEAKMEELRHQLQEAEAANRRSLSMAQQTRSGHVYIISNEGSFGEGVVKIGMTRRLEPLDRVKELGDASVPFEFDVHAMVRSEDAPSLEKALHHQFHEMRLNKVNFRKEFFRIPLETVRKTLQVSGMEATFTMLAEAREFRETQAIERMSPEEREKYFTKS